MQRHRHHAGARGGDAGLGLHPLSGRQRPLREVVQDPADGSPGLGRRVGAADLAENLLFTDHRTVQTTGHREEMLDGGLAVSDVGVLGELTHRHPGVVGQHLADHRQAAVEGVDHGVDLYPVTGGEQHRLGHQW